MVRVRPVPHSRSDDAPDAIGGNGVVPGKLPTIDTANFIGIGLDDGYLVPDAPPDPNGAVGATQYVQWVNVAFAVFDKATGALLAGPTNGNALWQGFSGRCANNNDPDPIAQYDKVAQRWVMMHPMFSSPYGICVAVSQTSDATGKYNRYEFDLGNGDLPDYPKLGVWPAAGNQAYFLTANIFVGAFAGAGLCALDRTQMLAGAVATMQCFQLASNYAGVLPGDFDGTVLPPSGEDESFVDFTGSHLVNFWRMHADFANPNNTTLTGPTSVKVPAFSRACHGGVCIPQNGTTQKLDSLGDRMMYRLAYRNFGDHESLVTNHSVTVDTRSAVRWYEFRNPTNPELFQSGNIGNKTLWYWMGSIAQDKMGNMAVGFSASSATNYPSIGYSGRTPDMALGKMKHHRLTEIGTGSQVDGLRRWGDYSSMTVDPMDDCTFYYTQEYLRTTGSYNWSTRVNAFHFTNCE
jgi:hypothetical protein